MPVSLLYFQKNLWGEGRSNCQLGFMNCDAQAEWFSLAQLIAPYAHVVQPLFDLVKWSGKLLGFLFRSPACLT